MRDAVHGQLTALLGPDGPLSVPSADVAAFLDVDLRAEIAHAYRVFI